VICLLDKGVVRLALNAVVLLRDEQVPWVRLQEALDSIDLLVEAGHCLAITPETANTLRDSREMAVVSVFLDLVIVLRPTRYWRRWARRIRDTANITMEDAKVLSHATFSESDVGLGVEQLGRPSIRPSG
jgi:hypothetical protein